MKKVLETWKYGFSYLLSDELASFYTFFTLIFAGCSWLFAYGELSVAINLTIVMLGYIANVMLFAWLKGNAEGTRREVTFSICYVAVFVALSIAGCIVNVKLHLIMLAIILAVTAICIWIREYQLPALFQSLALCAPIILLVIYFTKNPWIPTVLKIIIPIIYALCIPFVAYYEDYSAAQNIFELAYDNTWNPQFEERMRELHYSDKDIVV